GPTRLGGPAPPGSSLPTAAARLAELLTGLPAVREAAETRRRWFRRAAAPGAGTAPESGAARRLVMAGPFRAWARRPGGGVLQVPARRVQRRRHRPISHTPNIRHPFATRRSPRA